MLVHSTFQFMQELELRESPSELDLIICEYMQNPGLGQDQAKVWVGVTPTRPQYPLVHMWIGPGFRLSWANLRHPLVHIRARLWDGAFRNIFILDIFTKY